MQKGLWKKALVLAIIFLFVGAGVIPSLGGTVVEKTTFLNTKSGSYIQDLIDNASDGDTINIPGGTYYENIVIDKSINLVGENCDTTIIDGSGSGDVIYVSADWVNISGFTIRNSGDEYYPNYDAGIDIYSNYNTIMGNNLSNHNLGIYLYESNGNTISGNIISNNIYGIYLNRAHKNTIKGNNILNNDYGISLDGSDITFITWNNISNNIYGIDLLDSSNNNTIEGNNISKNNDGMQLSLSSENNNIMDNTILNNIVGISLNSDSKKNIVIGNNISKNYEGIELSYYSNNNHITDNTITNNMKGIVLYHTSNNTITSNTITSNTKDGIHLDFLSWRNDIIDNIISNNNDGIILDDSSKNTIYHNNLINNTQNANDTGDNTWNDGKYGNYWDDYKERYPDAKPNFFKPWMWNTPYEIPGGDNKDNCPLTDQWPKSKPRTIQKDIASYSSYLLRFLEHLCLVRQRYF